MSRVTDLQGYRRAKQLVAGPPARDPDLQLSVWLDGKGAEWTRVWHADVDMSHAAQVRHLLDGIFQYGVSKDESNESLEPERPALWVSLRNDGHLRFQWTADLVTDTNWRHSFWLLRNWSRASLQILALAWKAARGRG